jgi:PAS domain S-box-containing protein
MGATACIGALMHSGLVLRERPATTQEDFSKEKLMAAVAERDRILEELEEARSHYEDLYDFAPIAYFTLGQDTSILEVNLAGAALVGRERSAIIGKPFGSLVRLDDSMAFSAHLGKALASASPVSGEVSFASDAGHVTCQAVSVGVRAERGETPTSCRTAFFDVTQQKLAEVRLRQIEERERSRYEFLAKAAPLLTESLEDYEATLKAIARVVVPALADICVVDLVQEQGAARKVVARGANPSRQKLLDALVGAVQPIPQDVRRAIETKQPLRCEYERDPAPRDGADRAHWEKLGTSGLKSWVLAPMIVRGRVIGVLRLAMAESERRYTDDDLPLAAEVARMAALAVNQATVYAAAHTAIEARDNLLTFIAHDVRNYLSTIRMAGELLSRAGPEGERRKGRKQLEAIKRAAVRMEHLIEGLRDASMIETGQFAVQKEPQDTRTLAEEAVRSLEPQAEAASVRLTTHVEGDVPKAYCDGGRVLQVLANLVSNALRFTPSGGEVRITVEAAPLGVCFAVSDTGCGIPDEQLAHVFERHWRARPVARGSTGLGLYIAKGIVETHGGRIWVQSKVGEGTTFSFTLPGVPEEEHRPSVQST